MGAVEVAAVVEAIREAPGWARAGITAPKAELRDQAQAELAAAIVRRLSGVPEIDQRDQLALGL